MRIVRRAAIVILLAGAGLAPLGACGKDTDDGTTRGTEVRESTMPRKAPRDGRAPGSLTPGGRLPRAAPRPSGAAGSLTPPTGAAGGLVPFEAGDDGDPPPPPGRTGAPGGDAPPPAELRPEPGRKPVHASSIRTQTVAIQASGTEIIGTLTRPAGTERPLLVVMLHGYTGNRAEITIPSAGEGIFERAARRFADAGIASFRFDFAGSGESGGAWRDTTFTGQARDTRAVIAFLRGQMGFADTPIALLGFSQGGLVALKVAASGERVGRVALWNPVLDPERTYSRILGAEQVRDGRRLAESGEPDKLVGSTRLAAAFFADMHNADPIGDAAAYAGPMLIVSGARDQVAAAGPGLARQVAERRAAPTRLEVVPGDHGFGAGRGTSGIDRAIDATAAFLLGG